MYLVKVVLRLLRLRHGNRMTAQKRISTTRSVRRRLVAVESGVLVVGSRLMEGELGELAVEQELGVAWKWKWLRINSVVFGSPFAPPATIQRS